MKKKKRTKWSLFWRCSKAFSSLWLLIASIALILTVSIGIMHRGRPETILLVAAWLIVCFLLLLLVLLLLGQGKGFWLLYRQEKLLGFRFKGEDLDSEHPDGHWFLSTDYYLLAFRRGFIYKTGRIRKLYEGRSLCVMSILDCEGKKHQLRGFEPDLLALKQWAANEKDAQ